MTLILQGTDNSVSSPAVQGGTAGTTTGIYYPSTNQVAIASGGSKAIVVSQSNITNFYNNNNLRLYTTNEGNYGFLRNTGSGSSNSIELGANGVVIKVDDNYNATFYNSGAAQKTIITANNGIGIGGATPSSGTGITFPSAQDASSDANTLDDYEEGTFTPYLSDGTNSVALGNGWYTKIGRMVYVEVQGYNTNYSALSASSGLRITSLPFTSPSGINSQFNLATNNTSTYSCVGELGSSSTTAFVYLANNTVDYVGATRNNLVGGASTFSFRTSFFYFST